MYPERRFLTVHLGISPAATAFTNDSDISRNSLVFMPKQLASLRKCALLLKLLNFLSNSEIQNKASQYGGARADIDN